MKHLDTERPIAYIERTAPGRHAGKRKILVDLRIRKGMAKPPKPSQTTRSYPKPMPTTPRGPWSNGR